MDPDLELEQPSTTWASQYKQPQLAPLGLLLIVGNVYQVTVTATMADGTTETQTANVIYSLGAGIGF